jgi:SAM-dependent methyltransferase
MTSRNDLELADANRRFYDALWADAQLIDPVRFNTWPVVRSLLTRPGAWLEVAPGLRPRLPLHGTRFVDISVPALAQLRDHGGEAVLGLITALPFADASFDVVCALDVLEHVDDEEAAFSELSRVARPGAVMLLSVPLHPKKWTSFDDLVGHRRRYEPERLMACLAKQRIVLEQSAAYGMQPRWSRLVDFGTWFLTNRRRQAMWWYNRIFMPLAVRLQKPLALVDGLIETETAGAVFLVCRLEPD